MAQIEEDLQGGGDLVVVGGSSVWPVGGSTGRSNGNQHGSVSVRPLGLRAEARWWIQVRACSPGASLVAKRLRLGLKLPW